MTPKQKKALDKATKKLLAMSEEEFKKELEKSDGEYLLPFVVGKLDHKNNDMDENIVKFLYILLRDHLPSGAVEGIMEKHVENTKNKNARYTNPHVEAHARWILERLK